MNFAFVAFVYALFVTWRKWEKEEEKIASLNLLNLLCNGLVFWLLPQCKGDDYYLNTFLDAIANYDYNFRSLVYDLSSVEIIFLTFDTIFGMFLDFG